MRSKSASTPVGASTVRGARWVTRKPNDNKAPGHGNRARLVLRRSDMMRNDIHEGMTVRTRDGQKLGKVLSLSDDGFLIEKGLLFKKDFQELIAEKQKHKVGEVTVTKDVVTEEKQVTVPVTREEVVIEERPATGQPATSATFEAESIRVPVVEEDVTVEKRPVVKREVRVAKERREEQRTASAEVRREEAHVEGEGDVGRLSSSRRPEDEDPDRCKL
jgi:uncharacterized protein (TIGR02271 family)